MFVHELPRLAKLSRQEIMPGLDQFRVEGQLVILVVVTGDDQQPIIPSLLQTLLEKCRRHVLVSTATEVHQDDLIAHHFRRDFRDICQSVGALQRGDP